MGTSVVNQLVHLKHLHLPGILCINFCTIVAQHLVGSMLLVKIACLWPVVDFLAC